MFGVFDFVFVGNFNSRLGAWTDFRVDSKAMSFIAIFLQSLISVSGQIGGRQGCSSFIRNVYIT